AAGRAGAPPARLRARAMSAALTDLSVAELCDVLRSRRASAVEVVDAHLAGIRERDPRGHAVQRLAAHAAATRGCARWHPGPTPSAPRRGPPTRRSLAGRRVRSRACRSR